MVSFSSFSWCGRLYPSSCMLMLSKVGGMRRHMFITPFQTILWTIMSMAYLKYRSYYTFIISLRRDDLDRMYMGGKLLVFRVSRCSICNIQIYVVFFFR